MRTQVLHYLPIELRGQVFAIPMAEVGSIQRMPSSTLEEERLPGPALAPDDTMKIIDLGELFRDTGAGEPSRHRYVVLVTPPAGTCGVVVDGVGSARRAGPDDQFAVPHLALTEGSPFSGVVRGVDGLALVIDANRLVDQLHRVAPEVVMERAYA
jgi:chemotaxis signal transduction protein